MKIFEKTLFLKSPQITLNQLHIERKELRLLKAVGTLIGSFVLLALIIALSQSFSIFSLLLGAGFGGFIGWCIPEFYIQDRAKTHQFLLQQAVPTFLEQFHMMASSAGYESFPQTLKLIAPSFPGFLGDEFRRLMNVQPYLNENELLKKLTHICPHPLLKELAISIKVSRQYGTSLTSKTQHLVQSAQQLREQNIKDLANKTSGVLLGPLLLFHLPALLIIFLIPFLFILQKGF